MTAYNTTQIGELKKSVSHVRGESQTIDFTVKSVERSVHDVMWSLALIERETIALHSNDSRLDSVFTGDQLTCDDENLPTEDKSMCDWCAQIIYLDDSEYENFDCVNKDHQQQSDCAKWQADDVYIGTYFICATQQIPANYRYQPISGLKQKYSHYLGRQPPPKPKCQWQTDACVLRSPSSV